MDLVPVIEANSVRFLKLRQRTGDESATLRATDVTALKTLISSPSPKEKPTKKQAPVKIPLPNVDLEAISQPWKHYRAEEMQKEAQETVDHALELIVSRADAIKKAERLSLALKCQAVRDLQVTAKNNARLQDRLDELEMDEVMAQNQRAIFEAEQQKLLDKKTAWREQAANLNEQAALRGLEKAKEIARVEREWAIENRRAFDVAQEIEREKVLKAEKKEKTAAELRRYHKEMMEMKERQKIKEKEEDQKIVEFMREKARQEEEREKKKEMKKEDKRAILKELQETAEYTKLKDKGYDLCLLRAEEQRDREWRQKQREKLDRAKLLRQERLEEQAKLPAKHLRIRNAKVAESKASIEEMVAKMVKAKEMDEEEARERVEKIAACRKGLDNQLEEREKIYFDNLAKDSRAAAIAEEVVKAHERKVRLKVEDKLKDLEKVQEMNPERLALLRDKIEGILREEAA